MKALMLMYSQNKDVVWKKAKVSGYLVKRAQK